MASAHTGAAAAADGVDLIDENNGRGTALGLLKQVANAARADADIQLHKIRAGNGKELHIRLACHGAGQQRLTRARRADEQHALGDARADAAVFCGITQKIDDLLQLGLFLVRSGDVAEHHLVAAAAHAGIGVAELHHAAAVAHEHHVDERDHDDRQEHLRQHAHIPRCLAHGYIVIRLQNTALLLLCDQGPQILIEQAEVCQLVADGIRLILIGLAQLERQHAVVILKGADIFAAELLADGAVVHIGRVIPEEHLRDEHDSHGEHHDIQQNSEQSGTVFQTPSSFYFV